MARIGIFCRDLSVTGAEAQVIRTLISDTRHDISLVINVAEDRTRPPAGLAQRCFSLLSKIEAAATRRFSRAPHVDQVVRLESELQGIPVQDVSAVVDGRGSGHTILREDCVNIRGHTCDVLLNFAAANLRFEGPVPSVSGVLTLDQAAGSGIDHALIGFWEWFEDAPYTESVLYKQDGEAGGGIAVNGARYSTYRLSWSENRRRVVDRSRYLVLDGIDACAEAGRNTRRLTAMISGRRKPRVPNFRQLIVAGFTYLKRFIARSVFHALWTYQWGFALGPFNATDTRLVDFHRVFFPEKDRFWADPFLISNDGKDYVFVEELKFRTGIGTINCLEIEGNEVRANTVILEKPYHLSYPYIFEHDGAYYMCPEMSQGRNIEIFKCAAFPLRWEHHATLMEDVYATEISLHEVDGRWWLFTNMPRNSFNESCYELHLFSADSPFSRDWKPHPGNPVVQDAATARGGGGMISVDGRRYRMAQGLDRRTYGSNFVFNEILELSEDVYQERPVKKVYPDWMPGIEGAHHFARHRDNAVVDFKRRIPRFFK